MSTYPHHRGTDHSGRMSRRAAGRNEAALPHIAPLACDHAIDLPVPDPAIMEAGRLGPEIPPARVDTRSSCRLLTLRGLSEAEAANVTAVSAGLAAGAKRPWTRAQVNKILFLRELYASDWGARERHPG